MAQEPQSSALPVFYGERLPGNNVVERPAGEGRDALLRLPLQQPHSAHINSTGAPTPSAMPHNAPGLGSESMPRTEPDGEPHELQRYLPPEGRHSDDVVDTGRRSRRYEPYETTRAPVHIAIYPEEDDGGIRAYRRPSRRSTQPPLSYQNYSRSDRESGHPVDDRDGSFEPDTPSKAGYSYDSETERVRPYRARSNRSGGRGGPGAGAAGSGGGGNGTRPRLPTGGDPRDPEAVLRLPWTMWMNSQAKNHFVAVIGEFVGTTMFLFFAFAGTQVANIGASGSSKTTTGGDTGFSLVVLLYIALAFAFSLMVNVWVFFRISGGLFNPAVSFAMLLTRSLTMTRFFLMLIAQLCGSMFASFIVSVLFPTHFNVRTTLSTDTSLAQGIFIEALLTAELVFTIFMLAKEKHKATFIAPVGIGLALFIAELVGVFYTGGSLNPARSFGPCVVTREFDAEHWIYWLGPAIGAVIAVAFYNFIKTLEYEVANPGQDDDDVDSQVKVKVKKENLTGQ